jgi:carboxymethylenebutenolidase
MTIQEDPPTDLPTPTGPMRVHVLRPTGDGRFPGVVFFSEIFQVTAPIRRTAAWLAGHGYVVAVPEVYHELEPAGTVLAYDQAGADRGNAHKIAKPVSAYDADARACIHHLQARPDCTGNIGALGICLGGHLSFRCAMNPEVRAAACFYATDIHQRTLGQGKRDDSLDRFAEIKGELLMIWGRQDPHIPREGRRLVYDALADAGARFTWHEFNGQHAFMRDEGPRYDPAVAQLCQALLLDLFHRQLSA